MSLKKVPSWYIGNTQEQEEKKPSWYVEGSSPMTYGGTKPIQYRTYDKNGNVTISNTSSRKNEETKPKEEKKKKSILDSLKTSYDNYSNTHKDTPDFIKPIGYALETPYRIPVLNRLLYSADEAVGGNMIQQDGTKMQKPTTGSKVADTAIDVVGNIAGMGATGTNAGFAPGTNALNVTDNFTTGLSNQVARVTSNKLLPAITKGAADMGILTATQDIGEGKTIKDTTKDTLINSAGGAALMGAGKVLKEYSPAILSKIRNKGTLTKLDEVTSKVEQPVKTTSSVKSGQYTVKNAAFDKAQNDYNEAVKSIQDYWGHWKLDNAEIVLGAEELGINLDKILDDMATAEKTPVNISALGDRARLSKMTGVNTADIPKLSPTMNNSVLNRLNPIKETSSNSLLPKIKTVSNQAIKPLENNSQGNMQNISKFKTNTMKNANILQGDDIQKVVDDIGAMYEVKSNAQSIERATQELNSNYESVVNRIKKDGLNSAEDSAAAGIITNSLRKHAQETGDYTQLKSWLETVQPRVTNVAQTLQAISTWKQLTSEGALMKAQSVVENVNREGKKVYGKNFKPVELTTSDIKNIDDLMKKVSDTTDPRVKEIEFGKVKKIIADKVPPTLADKVKALQRISLLLNPKTQVRNVLGNTILTGLENAKDVVSTPIDYLLSKKTGKRTTTLPNLSTQMNGFKKGVKETIEDYKNNVKTGMTNGQFDLPQSEIFKNPTLKKLDRLTNTSLELGDRPFYQAAYQDALKQQLKINKVSQPTDEMIEAANKIAEERTLQNVSSMVKGFQSIQRGLNKLTGNENFGLGNVVLPFAKTPANILDKAIDYSPLGSVKTIAQLLSKKTFDQKLFVDRIGRNILGSAIIALGYDMAKNGLLTGKSNKDKEVAALEKQTGESPYAIKTGDTYRTIDWAQPAAIPLMIGADMYLQGMDKKTSNNAIYEAIKSGGSTLFKQSLLQGMSKLFGGYDPISGIVDSTAEAPLQLAPTAMKQLTQLMDGKQRDTSADNKGQEILNQLKAKTPILSKTLPAKVDTMGRESQIYQGKNNVFNVLLNPGYTTKNNPTKAEQLALDIYKKTGDTIQFPRIAKDTITYKVSNKQSETIKLTTDEKNKLQKFIGQETEKQYTNLANTLSFQNLSSKEQAKKLQNTLTDIYNKGEKYILESRGISEYKK